MSQTRLCIASGNPPECCPSKSAATMDQTDIRELVAAVPPAHELPSVDEKLVN
jgi:hypothetical protein